MTFKLLSLNPDLAHPNRQHTHHQLPTNRFLLSILLSQIKHWVKQKVPVLHPHPLRAKPASWGFSMPCPAV